MMKGDDIKLLRGFADRPTDGQTLVIVELLLQLKIALFVDYFAAIPCTIISSSVSIGFSYVGLIRTVR